MSIRRLFQMVCVAVMLITAGQADAAFVTVYFKGKLTNIESSGTVNAISQYLAVNNEFNGSFVYDTTVTGSSIGTIDNVGIWKQYNEAVTDFSLTFTSGSSSGFSIVGNTPSLSSMSVANNIKNSSNDPNLIDITSGVIWSKSDVFRTGLRNRNFVYRFWDFADANMVQSAELSTWNASTVFANKDVENNEIAFNSTETNFAQIAKFQFTEFTTAAPVPEPATMVLWGVGALGMGLVARRRAKKATAV